MDLRITDLEPFDTPHEMMPVDVADPDAVMRAAEGMDSIINLSVLRPHRKIAFDVNTLGCYNIMRAAVRNGIRRVINTGPHFTVQGEPYEAWDHGIGPDVPPKPGTNLYALSKGLGQEICRIFTLNYDVYVVVLSVLHLPDTRCVHRAGPGPVVSGVVARHAAAAFVSGLSIELDELPSRCEASISSAIARTGSFQTRKQSGFWGGNPEMLWIIRI